MKKNFLFQNGNLDDPQTTIRRSKIIKNKILLKNFYLNSYLKLTENINKQLDKQKIIEIGSGAGFIKEMFPSIITSDILPIPNLDRRFSALKMPFNHNSLDGVFAVDVLHHLPKVEIFFGELSRCLKSKGRLVVIEPASTLWSRFIYRNFHHEGFNTQANWGFVSNGPLSSANMALPWIVFVRDKVIFQKKYPLLKIVKIEYHTPFLYLLSGGFTSRQLVPNFTLGLINFIEDKLKPLNKYLGMFMTIVVEKV